MGDLLGRPDDAISKAEIIKAAKYIADTIILCSSFPGKFVDRMDPGDDNSMLVALAETLEPDSKEQVVIHIKGDSFMLLDLNEREEDSELNEQVNTYADPLYADLEAFVRLAGENARFGLWSSPYGRICYIYDNGPLTAVAVGSDGQELEDGYYTGGNMSYAYNMDAPDLSEWGICEVFPMFDETVADQRIRQREQFRQMLDVVSNLGELDVTIIGPDGEVDEIPAGAEVRLRTEAEPDQS